MTTTPYKSVVHPQPSSIDDVLSRMNDINICKTPLKTKTPAGKKTPAKTPKTPARDRFIPSIAELDVEMSHFNLLREIDQKPTHYTDVLAETMFDGKMKGKILKFKDDAPASKCASKASSLHALYSHNYCEEKPKAKHRFIPTSADRVLDAPNFVDDFYLNLLDWGPNALAIALQQELYIWNPTTSETSCLIRESDVVDQITSVAWMGAAHSSILAVGLGDGTVQLWDVDREKKVRTLPGHLGRVASLAWNSNILSSGGRDACIIHHDVRQSQHTAATLSGHVQEVCGLKWSPDGLQLASGGNDNLLNVWDAHITNAPRFSKQQHSAAVKALAWCPWESGLLASGGGSADRTICFWNTNTGALLNSIDAKSQVCSLLWSRHTKELVSAHGYSQNQLSLWRYPSLAKLADLTGHTNRVLGLAMSPDGEVVASVAGDETLRFWRLFGILSSPTVACS